MSRHISTKNGIDSECTTTRLVRSVFATGSPDDYVTYCDRLIRKAIQISNVIEDYRVSRFTIPDTPCDCNIIPVIVVEDPFAWNGVLKRLLADGLSEAAAFEDRGSTAPVFMSCSELEHLVYAAEQGKSLADELVDYLLGSDRDVRFEDHLYKVHETLGTPRFVLDGYFDYGNYVSPVLFPGEPPVGDEMRRRKSTS